MTSPSVGGDTTGRVVVGVDGSGDSVPALRAAARAAEFLHATLVVVTTWPQAPTFGRAPLRLPNLQAETEAKQSAAITAALGDHPPAELLRVVRSGQPDAALVSESEHARLVVVGRRGYGGFGALLLGSTAMAVVAHAACSVLVVGSEPRAARRAGGPGARRVVAGVDGEPPSLHALAAADRVATMLGARLDVVTVWPSFGGDLELDDFREAAGSAARAQQEAVIEQVIPPSRRARVGRIIREGGTAAVLVDEGERADVVVVGVRGRSALAEAFTGAVALTTAAHADCPVLVVRTAPTRT